MENQNYKKLSQGATKTRAQILKEMEDKERERRFRELGDTTGMNLKPVEDTYEGNYEDALRSKGILPQKAQIDPLEQSLKQYAQDPSLLAEEQKKQIIDLQRQDNQRFLELMKKLRGQK